MNEIVNQLAQSLFKKNSLQECNRWELEILADHYPYFGIAQFLVTGKLKDENADGYERQLEKTSLYFTNPLWLDYVINNQELPTAATPPPSLVAEAQPAVESPVEIPGITPEPVQDEQPSATAEMNTGPEEAFIGQIEDEPVDRFIAYTPTALSEKGTAADEGEPDPEEAEVPDEQAEEPGEELKIRTFKFESLQDPARDSPLSFEPYHTVDYFASQGIKMVQAEKPKDRFDQQLKSFTQWLKTIKQVPVTEITKDLGIDSEQKVITLAEHSIEDREVVTEAMAEVWTKQGNREKAIDIYHKLSLQNPAKSAYFAGLIEQLKRE